MFLLSLLPGLFAYAAAFLLWRSLPVWLALPLTPLVLASALIIAIACLRIPRMRSGHFPRAPLALRWQLALEQAARRAGLHYLLQAFYTTRFLHLRALGAKTHFSTNCSLDLTLQGVALLTVGPKATLALFSHISTYRQDAGGVTIAPVSIGAQAFIGKSAVVGPGCVVGDNAFVGMMNVLADGEHVAQGVRLADYSRVTAARP